jgi:hypothetical protein
MYRESQGRYNRHKDCQEAIANTRKDLHEELGHVFQVEALADVKQVRAIAAVSPAAWDPSALRTEQLNNEDIGPILEEVETEQRPEWKEPHVQKLWGPM